MCAQYLAIINTEVISTQEQLKQNLRENISFPFLVQVWSKCCKEVHSIQFSFLQLQNSLKYRNCPHIQNLWWTVFCFLGFFFSFFGLTWESFPMYLVSVEQSSLVTASSRTTKGVSWRLGDSSLVGSCYRILISLLNVPSRWASFLVCFHQSQAKIRR